MASVASAAAPLAIVCGGGAFPLAVADAVAATRPVFLLGIRGAADPAIARRPHAWMRLGQLKRPLALARSAGCRDILFVGTVRRPRGWRDIWPDLAVLRLIPRLWTAFRGGDDHLLKAVAAVVAEHGLALRGVHEVAPSLILPPGVLGRHAPTQEGESAARFGLSVLDALAPYDVGQSLVVAERRVLAVEAAEGTDMMLQRVAELRDRKRVSIPAGQGVLVKAPKRGQDLRLDTPAIGLATIDRAKVAGLSGIAIAAGQVMTLDVAQLIAAADRAGLFVLGLERPE